MKRIRYLSEFVSPMTAEQIDELTRASASNNERDDITGMLVASGQLFFQLIEGPDAAVDALFERIMADSRHRNVLVLRTEQGDLKRMCPDWAMRKADLSALADVRAEPIKAILMTIEQQRHSIQTLSETLERVMWRELIDAELGGLAT